jgi:hypothetical protein
MNPRHRENLNSAASVTLAVGVAVVMAAAILAYLPVIALDQWRRGRRMREGSPWS